MIRLIRGIFLLGLLLLIASCGSDTTSKKSEKPQTSKKSTETTAKNKTKPVKVEEVVTSTSKMANQKAIYTNIDYNYLNSLLLSKINQERTRLGLKRFKDNSKLERAAKIHNDYMVAANVLEHDEVGTSTPTMNDRVKKAGGNFNTFGENIQYAGYVVETRNGVESIISPTYAEITESLWKNWRDSPPHYKNIVYPKFTYVGTSLKWSPERKAIYATQLYGG